ncbi:MAG: hypothetical protein ACRDNZ_17200 [Streptosporangiaceae bacterium]
MSDGGDVLLGRAGLERAFTALGERLARRGVVADVFLVGGAAMALAYDATRVTRDVDAMFVPHGIVVETMPYPPGPPQSFANSSTERFRRIG